jgi:hypothetical protein
MRFFTHNVNGDKLAIAPFGDVQSGNEGFSEKYYRRYLGWTNQRFADCDIAYVGTGDYTDCMSPSNRAGYKASGIYSSTKRLIQRRAFEYVVHDFVDITKPYTDQGTVVALARGHHWASYDKPVEIGDEDKAIFDTDTHIAHLLGTKTFPAAAIVKFAFPGVPEPFRLFIQHGQGNGQSLAYMLNKMSRLIGGWENVDAMAVGHSHKLGFIAASKIREVEERLVHRPVPLISAGSFLKAYLENDEAYPEEKQLGALALGASVLRVERVDGEWQMEPTFIV